MSSESEYTNETEQTSVLLLCFLPSHTALDKTDEELSMEPNLLVWNMKCFLVTLCSVTEQSLQGKRDHWINSMNFMNVDLICSFS